MLYNQAAGLLVNDMAGSRTRATLLGIAASMPLLTIAAFAFVFLSEFRPRTIPLGEIILTTGALSMLVFWSTMGYFLYLLHNRINATDSEKTSWSMIMLLFFPIGVVGFWYRFIWRNRNS